MKPPQDPYDFATRDELNLFIVFVFVAGFLLGVECHAIYWIWRNYAS